MNMHVTPPGDSGDGKLRFVGSILKQLADKWLSAQRDADNDKDESQEASTRHYRRIIRIENKILNTPLNTLADIADAADVLLMDGEPEFDDRFFSELAIKIVHAVKKLHGEKPPRRKPIPIPGRISNAELQREIDATNNLIAKLPKKTKRIGKR